jgi:hypothetical protein
MLIPSSSGLDPSQVITLKPIVISQIRVNLNTIHQEFSNNYSVILKTTIH